MLTPTPIFMVFLFGLQLALVHANGRDMPTASGSSTTTTIQGRFWTTVSGSKTIIQGVGVPVAHTMSSSTITTATHAPTTPTEVTTPNSIKVASSSFSLSESKASSLGKSNSASIPVPSALNSAPTAPASGSVSDTPGIDTVSGLTASALPAWKLGIIIGVVISVLLIICVVVFCCWRRKKSKRDLDAADTPLTPVMTNYRPPQDLNTLQRPERTLSPGSMIEERNRVVSESNRTPNHHFNLPAESERQPLNTVDESNNSTSRPSTLSESLHSVSTDTLPSARSIRESTTKNMAARSTSSISSGQEDYPESDTGNEIEMENVLAKERWSMFASGKIEHL